MYLLTLSPPLTHTLVFHLMSSSPWSYFPMLFYHTLYKENLFVDVKFALTIIISSQFLFPICISM